MKGQMFFLASTIILIFVVSLIVSVRSPQIARERRLMEATLEKRMLENFVRETESIPTFLSTYPSSIADKIREFMNYSRMTIERKGVEFRSLVVSMISNSTTSQLNVSVINFLKDKKTVKLELNTSVVQTETDVVNDTGIWVVLFSITPGEYYTLKVNVTEDNYTKEVGIATKAGRDVYTGFFDMKMISENDVYAKESSVTFSFG